MHRSELSRPSNSTEPQTPPTHLSPPDPNRDTTPSLQPLPHPTRRTTNPPPRLSVVPPSPSPIILIQSSEENNDAQPSLGSRRPRLRANTSHLHPLSTTMRRDGSPVPSRTAAAEPYAYTRDTASPTPTLVTDSPQLSSSTVVDPEFRDLMFLTPTSGYNSDIESDVSSRAASPLDIAAWLQHFGPELSRRATQDSPSPLSEGSNGHS